MKKIIIFLLFVTNLLALSANNSSNIKMENGCLADIQKQRDGYIKTHYTSLVFEKNLDTAREHSKRGILKKINLQIQSTATFYYKNKTSSKNGVVLKNKTQKDFKQSIATSTLDINIDSLAKEEFYCKVDDELFFVYAVKRKDVLAQVKATLESLSKKNKKILSSIYSNTNFLERVLLFEEIQTNYLPYLMILESSKTDKKLRARYFKEIRKYKNAYTKFLKNIVFLVEIKYPENRVYPIEERVDEVRQEIIKYLAKHSISATSIKNSKSINSIVRKTRKDVAVISILLEEVETNNADHYRLAIKLKNTNKRIKKKMQKQNSLFINFPDYEPQWNLNLKHNTKKYHKKNDIIYVLSGVGDRIKKEYKKIDTKEIKKKKKEYGKIDDDEEIRRYLESRK